MEDIYNLGKRANEAVRKRGKKQLGEMMQVYVDKFRCDPLLRNLSTDTYKHIRFVADFTNVKKYNEYCLMNTKSDAMNGGGDSDDEQSDLDEDIVKDTKMTDEIA